MKEYGIKARKKRLTTCQAGGSLAKKSVLRVQPVFLTYVRDTFFLHLLAFYTSCFSICIHHIKEFGTLSVVETVEIWYPLGFTY